MAASRFALDRFRLQPALVRLMPFAPLVVLVTLVALCIYPILTGGLPTTGDGLNHFYRFAELDWHIRHGDFYPRWFSNLHYGFGAPVLNFYGPLSYYIPFLFRLIGLPLATSLQLSYALALVVAIVGVYKWVSELVSQNTLASLAALLAAAAYGLAPYFYLNIFHRGAYPETWALAFFPWLLWSAHRLLARPNALSAHLAFIVLSSAIILTHTLSALIFLPAASLYFLSLTLKRPLTNHYLLFTSSRFLIDISLIFALTAFFTLPLFFESSNIQLNRTYSTGDLDYHRNFLNLGTLLSSPANFDPWLVFNTMPPSLGWPQVILAVNAIILLVRKRETRWMAVVLGILGLLFCLLPLSFTEPLWNLFPFSRFIQFPWRLVGPASLFVAGLAGLSIASIRNGRAIVWLSGIGLLGIFLFSLPWTYHADFSLNAPIYASPADTIRYEIDYGQLGTSSAGEYLPRWVTEPPDPETLLQQFADTDLPSHLTPPPAGVTFDASRLSPTSETLTYTSASDFTLTYNLFYFPGWAATLDNQPVELTPSVPNGLITINAPAGTHNLKLYRQLTLPQLAGTIISVLTLVGLVVYGLRLAYRRASTTKVVTTTYHPPLTTYGFRLSALVSLLVLTLIVSRPIYFDRTETIFHYTNTIPNPTSVNFDNQLELIGSDFQPALISGLHAERPISLYWRAIQPLTADYSVSVQMADRFGNRFGQSDSQHPNGVPTSRWRLDQYAHDAHSLFSLEGTPPGTYHLLVTVYSDHPLSVLQDGAPVGVEYDLGTVQVTAPPSHESGLLALVSTDLATNTVSVGDSLAFTALWFSGNQSLSPLLAQVELVDANGQSFYSEALPPAGPDYPTDQWILNTLVRYPLSITLPPDLAGGAARVRLALVDVKGVVTAGPYEVGSVLITVPERTFEIPSIQVRVDHDFNESIRLLGYDINPDSITLYWQSLKTISTKLTVFVHTLDNNGLLVNGHDAALQRPTTSWLPGEVITDIHPIVITDRFEIGLYDPITDARFGETFVTRR